ncbi:MAG: ComF family protein [Saprospirales bacterium]|nr:MAG: ComF family protein [Saprospirales bacterium]
MLLGNLSKPFYSITDLIFPELCPCCQHSRPMRNHIICLSCLSDLPFTGHEKYPKENETAITFWGRIPLKGACSIFYFNPKGKIRNVLHRIKYEGRKDIAIEMGKLMGQYLKKAKEIRKADLILPVPLHPKRKATRGFNQSDFLAKGLSLRTGIPWTADAVIRTRDNPTQTKLSRELRFENTNQLFRVTKASAIKNKHIILLDDVITTGATLESFAEIVLKAEAASVSIVTLACGELM